MPNMFRLRSSHLQGDKIKGNLEKVRVKSHMTAIRRKFTLMYYVPLLIYLSHDDSRRGENSAILCSKVNISYYTTAVLSK